MYAVDIAVVGDDVEYELNADKTGVIKSIYPRRNYISRKAPKIKGVSYRGERLEQIIASNIDNLFIIGSVTDPPFNNKVIDRFLVTGESAQINTILIFNKTDLDDQSFIDDWFNLYTSIGYKVVLTSIPLNKGFEELKELTKDKRNIFWGHSGVGKSSIINHLFPSLELNTHAISNFTGKGMHTTVTSVLNKIDKNTYLIDTPGIREIDPYGIKKEDLGHYFIEFEEYISECKFNTCTHTHEPGCAVIEGVESGDIYPERYDSYLRILNTIEDDINF